MPELPSIDRVDDIDPRTLECYRTDGVFVVRREMGIGDRMYHPGDRVNAAELTGPNVAKILRHKFLLPLAVWEADHFEAARRTYHIERLQPAKNRVNQARRAVDGRNAQLTHARQVVINLEAALLEEQMELAAALEDLAAAEAGRPDRPKKK